MTKPLMGTNRSDNRESRCRAKDPDHCPYHKPGSHVPYDPYKMMRMNEKVMAVEAKKAGMGGALKKAYSSSINQVSSKPVRGSIFNSKTLNKNDMQFLARVGRKYARMRMNSMSSGDGDLQTHTNFSVVEDPEGMREQARSLGEYMAKGDGHSKYADSLYSSLRNGTIADAAGIRPDDDKRTAIRKGVEFLANDPRFPEYMRKFKKEFIVHSDDPAEENYESKYSEKASTAGGAQRILDKMNGRTTSPDGHVSSKPVDGSIFNSNSLNTDDMKFIARVGRRYAFTLMQRESSGDGDLQSHTDFHISSDPESLASLSNETAEDMAFSGGHQKRRDSMYSALKRGTIAEAAGIKPDDDEKTAIRKGAKFISSDPKFTSYMKNFQKEFTVHADDPAEEKYDSRISDRASTADGARSVIRRMFGRK